MVESILENSKSKSEEEMQVIRKEELDEILRNYDYIPALVPRKLLELMMDKTITLKDRSEIKNQILDCLESKEPLESIKDLEADYSNEEIYQTLTSYNSKQEWWFEDLSPAMTKKQQEYYLVLMDEILVTFYNVIENIRIKNKRKLEESNQCIEMLNYLSLRVMGRVAVFSKLEQKFINKIKKFISEFYDR